MVLVSWILTVGCHGEVRFFMLSKSAVAVMKGASVEDLVFSPSEFRSEFDRAS